MSQGEVTCTWYYVRDNAGNLIDEVLPSGARYYYLVDGLGSVVGLTDGTGTLAATYSYDPYGTVPASTGSQAGNNPWQFASGYVDGMGYEKFGARYYDPTLGRWTQQDPVADQISNPTSICRYAYAHDDPVNLTDPSGYCDAGSLAFDIAATLLGTGGAISAVLTLPITTLGGILGAIVAYGFAVTYALQTGYCISQLI